MKVIQKIVPVIALLLLIGCMSKQTGGAGLLEFSYITDDDILDFNKAIAIGAKLDVQVSAAGAAMLTPKPQIKAAKTDDPTIIKVDSFSGNTVTITGA